MRLRGRVWLVAVVVCLGLMPARSEADVITTDFGLVGAGTLNLANSFSNDNDVALFSFELDNDASITAEISSFICTTPDCGFVSGFVPILTLFGPGTEFLTVYDPISAATPPDDSAALMLTADLVAGSYLLAITQYNNDYIGAGQFQYDGLPAFTSVIFGDPPLGTDAQPLCTQFITTNLLSGLNECRNSNFSGTLTIEPSSVPEPATLSLLALGGAALAARRRRRAQGDS